MAKHGDFGSGDGGAWWPLGRDGACCAPVLEPLEPRVLLSASSGWDVPLASLMAEPLAPAWLNTTAPAQADDGDELVRLPSVDESDIWQPPPPDGAGVNGFVATGVYDVYVEPGLLASIQDAMDQYVLDLTGEGYTVTVQEFSGDAADLRNELSDRYTYDNLEGALFVGDLPTLTFRNDHDFNDATVNFVHDLYFMDLDGEYVLYSDNTPDEHFDGAGDVGPEIYVSRITTSRVTGLLGKSESQLINEYFARVHDYRTGALTFEHRGVMWSDDDWSWNGSRLNGLYGEILTINDDALTTRDSYLDTLTLNYETMFDMIHSSVTYHQIEGTGGGKVNSSDLIDLPRIGFFNLWNCSSGKFTSNNNLIATYVYGQDHGLNAVGTTKTGAMLTPDSFYDHQGAGDSMGQSFARWFDSYARETTTDGSSSSYVNWHYGMTMQGDPTLRPAMMGDAPPRVVSHTPVGPRLSTQDAVTISFNREMDPASFAVADDLVSFVGPGGVDLLGAVTGHTWADGQTLEIQFASQSGIGDYLLVLGPEVLDLAGHALDQDMDGHGGEPIDDRYEASFSIANTPPQIVVNSPVGSRVLLADNAASLVIDATVTDDGASATSLTTSWSVLDAPDGAAVTFSDIASPTTLASFSHFGSYVLRLTANDGGVASTADVAVMVGGDANVYYEEQGLIVVEAEGYTGSAPGSGAAAEAYWQGNESYADTSGLALKAMPNVGVNVGDSTDGPRLDYAIDFATPGVYQIWVRMWGESGSDDSVHVGLDGAASTYGSMGLSDSSNRWAWAGEVSGTPVTVVVDEPGRHVLNLWMREDGVAVDKVVMAMVGAAAPTGQGPDAQELMTNTAPRPQVGTWLRSDGMLDVAATGGDDGQPNPPAAITYLWQKIDGPGGVSIADDAAAETSITVGQAGTYTFRLFSDDGQAKTARDVTLPVSLPGDLDLSGSVSFIEAAIAAACVGMTGADWSSGDVDGDGVVTVDEAAMAVANIGQSLAPLPPVADGTPPAVVAEGPGTASTVAGPAVTAAAGGIEPIRHARQALRTEAAALRELFAHPSMSRSALDFSDDSEEGMVDLLSDAALV